MFCVKFLNKPFSVPWTRVLHTDFPLLDDLKDFVIFTDFSDSSYTDYTKPENDLRT